MGRIFNYMGDVIDLGNIKHIEKKYADTTINGYPCDWYVQIELLNDSEYVLNPNTGETELIKSVIKIKYSDGSVATVIKDISEQWEKYLEREKEDRFCIGECFVNEEGDLVEVTLKKI